MKFKNTDPATLKDDPRIIFTHKEFIEHKDEYNYLFILSENGYLIFATLSFYIYKKDENTPIKRKWLGGTKLEVPKSALPWFIWCIEEQFFKTAEEGGLPKDKFGCETEINNERLVVSRMFGVPGYSFKNHSRKTHLIEGSKMIQYYDFDDETFFDKGLFEELKVLAKKIENNEI
jgi:hypothetical protein